MSKLTSANVQGDLNNARSRLRLLTIIFVASFMLIGLMTGFWSVVRASAILARNDNPRFVEAELQIQRGKILDVNKNIVAESVGSPGGFVRRYVENSTGPAVGYYSFRHGTAGIEEGYDKLLRGETENFWEEFWRQTLHKPPVGQDIRITLNTHWQRAAETLLADDIGAIILVTVPDVEIRVMASHPGFDPNRLEDEFEKLVTDETAPLLNRATQGLYQPGLALQPFILAGAISNGITRQSESLTGGTDPVTVNGETIYCLTDNVTVTAWVEVVEHGCPAPFVELASLMGASALEEIYRQFGFLNMPVLPIRRETPDFQPVVDLGLAGIGQDTLTVSPLQMALALASLAHDGQLRQANLVLDYKGKDGRWLPASTSEQPMPAISAQVATIIRELLPVYDGMREHATMALTGPKGNRNAWYLGIAPAGDPRYAIVVVIENTSETKRAVQIGRSLLNLALDRRQAD